MRSQTRAQIFLCVIDANEKSQNASMASICQTLRHLLYAAVHF